MVNVLRGISAPIITLLFFSLIASSAVYSFQLVDGGEPFIMWTWKGDSGLTIADLDGDGSAEVIVNYASELFILSGRNGSVLEKFTKFYVWSESVNVADLDGDGDNDIVFPSKEFIVALDGSTLDVLWVADPFENMTDYPRWDFCSLGDVNGDGFLDVIAYGSYNKSAYLVALDGRNGSIFWITPYARYFRSLSLGDLNGDGYLDVFAFRMYNGEDSVLFAFNGRNGSLLWRIVYPFQLISDSGVLGDIDGDGRLEVVLAGDRIYAFNGEDGSLLWKSELFETPGYPNTPSLVDVDGDGLLDIVYAGDMIHLKFSLYAFSGVDGRLIWKVRVGSGTAEFGEGVGVGVSIGDLDGDDRLEIVVATSASILRVFNLEDGSLVYNFTYQTHLLSYTFDPPLLGDIDEDGRLEVVVSEITGRTYAIDFPLAGFRLFWQGVTGDLGLGTRNVEFIDVDGDGLSDYSEGFIGTDPFKFDSDGDGLSDLDEFLMGSDPLVGDSDGDGLPDGWEWLNGLDFLDSGDAGLDFDGDGLSNLQEFRYGTDPLRLDSDGDFFSDGFEISALTDPLNPWDNLLTRLSIVVLVFCSVFMILRKHRGKISGAN